MGGKYANPPLVEAICEFRLASDTAWDMAIPGLIYKRLKSEFPVRKQRLFQETEFAHREDGFHRQIRVTECVLLFAEDRRAFVQLGPRWLMVNVLRPYPTWMGFKSKIELAFEALGQVVEIVSLERVGLRYINRIDGLDSSVELGRYLGFYPTFGFQLGNRAVDFAVDGEFVYAGGRDRCRIRLGTVPTGDTRHTTLVLDIHYFLAREVEAQAVMGWLEEAHDGVVGIFEECITDALREKFRAT